MTRITISDAFAAQLHDLTSSAELCDQSGRVLGTFIPVLEEDREVYSHYESPISDDEVR